MEEITTEIILKVLGIVALIIGGGALYSKIKKRSTVQKDITITGNQNKIIGGDDKSTS
ncbi:hypothetical protein [Flavobacterium bizetiae]|uniref:hypothetical protein n=1 Tax=Flavobacterium bizetiae TaxID=2704140 RepID=UPI00375812B7